MLQGPLSGQVVEACQVHLRILATSDLHMHLLPFDYGRNRASVALGLARTAGLIATYRAGAPNVLLVDNGDFLQGSPMADLVAADVAAAPAATERHPAHPIIAAMNALAYDAVALGNHEFNYGLAVLDKVLRGAAFPVLAANAAVRLGATPCADHTLVAPHALLTRQVTTLAGESLTLRIGLIGLVPPQTAQWDRDNVAGRVWFRDMLETAAARVPELRAGGADVVVMLAHTGIGSAVATDGMENAAIPLARIPGVDALVLGHAHQVFPSPQFAGFPGVDAANGLIEGRPAVMPGAYGSHLGVLDLTLRPTDEGWRVAASSVAAQPVARPRGRAGRLAPQGPLEPRVTAIAAPAHARTQAWGARTIGYTTERLSTHFALVADTPAFRLVAEAKVSHVRERLARTEWEGLPVLGSGSPFRTGGLGGPRAYTDIPPGRMTARHVANLYCFNNQLRAVLVSGADLYRWLEGSAALYRTVAAGESGQPLVLPEVPGYTLSLLSGLRFEIRADRAPGQRIVELSLGGRPVAMDDRFVIATSSYRAALSAPQAHVILAEDVTVAHLIERFVAMREMRRPAVPSGWRLRLPGGALVTFDTAPTARVPPHLGSLEAQDIGLQPTGFRRFVLRDTDPTG